VKTYAEKRAETERLMAMLPAVREELMRIPGVTRVAVGVRERAGRLTEEFVFRVHVEQKLPESALSREHIVPKAVRGVPTDVVVRGEEIPDIGFNDENDHKKYRPLVGGCRVGAEVAGGSGTMGAVCRRTIDDKVVLLSNWHVLIDPGGAIGDGVGQPHWRKSCCCTCDRVGTVLAFAIKPLDCAIAELRAGEPFAPKIRRILRNDGSIEQEGFIAGSAAPVAGDEVYKVGARTGLTRGIIDEVDTDRMEVVPNPGFPRMSNSGDSGSVYVSLATDMVCGLHRSRLSGTPTTGVGTPFDLVMSTLSIDVIPTDPDTEYEVADIEEESLVHMAVEPPFAAIVDRMQMSPAERELLRLIETHRHECLDLVNRGRRFTVAWHRAQGPAYLAALARSARDPSYRIPQRINGVSRNESARRLADALRRSGSPALTADLQRLGPALAASLVRADTIEEMLHHWEEARLAAR
jgi:hypothetical protein